MIYLSDVFIFCYIVSLVSDLSWWCFHLLLYCIPGQWFILVMFSSFVILYPWSVIYLGDVFIFCYIVSLVSDLSWWCFHLLLYCISGQWFILVMFSSFVILYPWSVIYLSDVFIFCYIVSLVSDLSWWCFHLLLYCIPGQWFILVMFSSFVILYPWSVIYLSDVFIFCYIVSLVSDLS